MIVHNSDTIIHNSKLKKKEIFKRKLWFGEVIVLFGKYYDDLESSTTSMGRNEERIKEYVNQHQNI